MTGRLAEFLNIRTLARWAGVMVLAALPVTGVLMQFSAEKTASLIPPPAIDEPPTAAREEVAIFAGGCFWGVQGIFQHVAGVTEALAGYAGGASDTAHYNTVIAGGTGHAESVQVRFDPRHISYGKLLQIYFSVAHNPTELNRQGPDIGAQYRSALFPLNAMQKRVADAYIAQLNRTHLYTKPIATRTETFDGFYPAEEYNQDYMAQNMGSAYIAYNDVPRLVALHRVFPALYRDQPTLVWESSNLNLRLSRPGS